jgi:hypothetical protein
LNAFTLQRKLRVFMQTLLKGIKNKLPCLPFKVNILSSLNSLPSSQKFFRHLSNFHIAVTKALHIMQTLYQTLLALHITGFTAAIGTLISSLVSYNQFWKLYAINREQGKAAFNSFLKTRKVEMIGLLVTILAGIGMVIIMGGTYDKFLWFKIKMPLVLLILINGILFGRTTVKKLQKFITGTQETLTSAKEIVKLKRVTGIFQYSQLFIFLLIIILAAFRFS